MKMYLVDTYFTSDNSKTADELLDSKITCPVTISNVISFTPVDVEQAKAWVKQNKADEIKKGTSYELVKMFSEISSDNSKDSLSSFENYLTAEQPCEVTDVIYKYPLAANYVIASCYEDVEL